jgi:hypothetical protein
VSQLVRIACFGVTSDALEQTLLRTDLNDEQLARLQDAFATQQFRDGLKRLARGEQFFLIHVVQSDLPAGDPLLERTRWLPARGADLAKGMELWREVIDATDEGLSEGLDATEAMNDEIETIATSRVAQMRYTTTVMLLPAVQAVSHALLRAEADARLSQTALACERFQLRNDRYPDSLDELVPEYLPSVPEEPFAAIPLRYRPGDAEALLYSRSVNRQDDAGQDHPLTGDIPFALKSDHSEPAEDDR